MIKLELTDDELWRLREVIYTDTSDIGNSIYNKVMQSIVIRTDELKIKELQKNIPLPEDSI